MKDASSLAHLGENIRILRRRRGLLQMELAEKLGMRPGPVNCIEKGRNLPSAKVLFLLSGILDVPVDAFFSETPSLYLDGDSAQRPAPLPGPEAMPPRGPCAVPARTREEYAAMPSTLEPITSRLADAMFALEDLCGARKQSRLPLLLPFDRTEAGVEALGSTVRRLLGVSEAVIYDPIELLENAGLRIACCPLPGKVESMAYHDMDNGNAFVFVATNGSITAERQLFRLCFELGRLYAHAPDGLIGTKPVAAGRDRRGKPLDEDRIARRFAALFLMPEATVRSTVVQLGVRPEDWSIDLLYRIKHRFGVSAEAFLYRLDELGLVSSPLRKQFRRDIRACYEHSGHSEPDSTRRVLSLNGRLGDLLHVAGRHKENGDEVARLRTVLADLKLPGLP